MAKSDAVWGIDIGNCSLKALRCRPGTDPQTLEALAFDFIEYPKIRTQPDVQPEEAEELVAEALKQFLSRNETRGDRISLSVSGQNGLARFIKLPPVEAKKIPDMVKYEARQQIPFDLQDVVWDYQRLGIGAEEGGVVMDTEIGLFAMKRDVAYRAIAPLQKAGLEVDFLQLTPLSLFNFAAFDQIRNLPSVDEYDPDHPPASIVVLSMGTDATDFVVTNGYKVWQRSIPIGGNHFTKALTKELKLTFTKAEHLKRNVTAAQDAKTVFQAMRPVFNLLLTEIQRSIGFFTNLDRKAEISKIITLGNPMKLPGLRKYLAQSLGLEVERGDQFIGLAGPEVIGAPAFKDNQMCFGVAYGLALQGLALGKIGTNLMPAEILKDRMIRAKKPWALATAATILLGFTVSYVGATQSLNLVGESRFKSAESTAASVQSVATGLKSRANDQIQRFLKINKVGEHLTSNIEGRIEWLELIRAIQAALPVDRPTPERAQMKLADQISDKKIVYITDIVTAKATPADIALWFDVIKSKEWYELDAIELAAMRAGAAAGGEGGATASAGASPELTAPTIEGDVYVVQLRGYHYHNSDAAGLNMAGEFVRRTLIHNLKHGSVMLAPSMEKQEEARRLQLPPTEERVTMRELGIMYPTLIDEKRAIDVQLDDPAYEKEVAARRIEQGLAPGASGGSPYSGSGESYESDGYYSGGSYGPSGAMTGPDGLNKQDYVVWVRRFDFVVQFLWKPTPPSVRDANRAKEEALMADDGSPDFNGVEDMSVDVVPPSESNGAPLDAAGTSAPPEPTDPAASATTPPDETTP